MNLRREPVVLISGVISAAVIALTALGLDLPEGAEAALQAAVVAVAGVVAAWKVRQPGRPAVVIGGLVSAAFVLLTTFGVDLGQEAQTTIQAFIALVASWIVRGKVTPVEDGE